MPDDDPLLSIERTPDDPAWQPVLPRGRRLGLVEAESVVRGAVVLPHVQAFADEVGEATGATSFGTYPGHDPAIDRALDIFVPVDDATLGNAITAFALANWERFGLLYVIFRQRINSNDGRGWRLMEDRSVPGDPQQSLTNNHFDHVHTSFLETGDARPEGDFMAALTEDEQRELLNRLRSLNDEQLPFTNAVLTELKAELSQAAGTDNWHQVGERLRVKFEAIGTGGVDIELLADKIAEQLGPEIAEAVADKLAARLKD